MMLARTLGIAFHLVVAAMASTESASAPPVPPNNVTSRAAKAERKWITQLFTEAAKNFDMGPNVSRRCASEYQRYKLHFLQNQTTWAVRMAESSEWPTGDIVFGTINYMGNWEDCMRVSSRRLRGQYCMVHGVYQFRQNAASVYGASVQHRANEEASVWDTLQMYQKNKCRLNRQILGWAMCIPASCSHRELEATLNGLLPPLFRSNEMNITVRVNPLLCSVQETTHFSTGFYLVSSFMLLFITVVLVTGLYECIRGEYYSPGERRSVIGNVFEDFSWMRSFAKLTLKSKSTELVSINGSKIFYMVFVIFGHRVFFLFQTPWLNAERGELEYYPWSLKLTNMTVVDVFFLISGFLTYYHGAPLVKKFGGIAVVVGVITRWMRMVPVWLVVQLFIIYVLPYLSSGPIWKHRTSIEVENCKASFWANFFALSNLWKADKQCLVISWYIAVDIQLTLIGCLLLLVIAKNRKLGLLLTVSTFVGACLGTFAVVYINRYNGLMLLVVDFIEHVREYNEFNYFYTAVYVRLPPYVMGFMAGWLAKGLREQNYKFSTVQGALMLAVSLGLKLSVMVYGMKFYQFGRAYDPLENAIYAATSKWLYCTVIATLILIHATTGIAFFNRLGNSKCFVSFARLTYSAFLTNTVVMLLHASSQRTPVDSTLNWNYIWWTMSDFAYAYLAGFLLYLFFENPIANIAKRILEKVFSSLIPPKIDSSQTDVTALEDVAESAAATAKTEER